VTPSFPDHVRFAPKPDNWQIVSDCPFCAKTADPDPAGVKQKFLDHCKEVNALMGRDDE
jgi:hypothetical protein